jgi:peptidyl-prolyl cis-trans isomerase SurA
MKKFRLFKLILLTLFVFKIFLTPSFANYDLETESKLWEKLDKNLKEKKQEKQKEKEQEDKKLKQAQEEKRQKEQEEKRQKEQEEEELKQAQEEKKLKKAQEAQRKKEIEKQKILLSKLFPKNETSIIAKINNEIITSRDLIVEIKYLEALNPNLKKLTEEQKIKVAKESIIREKIKTIEILKYFELEQDSNYLDEIIVKNFEKLGLKNKIEFKSYLSKYDLTIDDVKKKFEIEVIWNSLIFKKYKEQVNIDVEKLKKKLNEEKSKVNKQEVFLLSEILFNAENKKTLEKKYKKILKSIKEIGFKNTANIYSVSDTAKFGGLLGWIQKNQISEKVYNELSKINVGEITGPIIIPGGVIIIKIDEKKISELEIDFNRELKKMIQFEKNKQLRQFSSIYFKKIKNNAEIYEN